MKDEHRHTVASETFTTAEDVLSRCTGRQGVACLLVACALGFVVHHQLAAAAENAAPARQPTPCTPMGEVACTEGGAVQGTTQNGVRAYKGIPYARPPVGALRFRPPQPAAAWEGVLAANQFGPVCPQLAAGNKVIGSEDCLRINVWTPARTARTLLPVMIWLHGGGNAGLSGAGTSSYGGVVYDGSLMVQRGGVVFVTYNLRLGVLGFLAHPSLDAERPEKISGNYGNLDQVAMLQWVRRNIRSFGGDPERVFLFGTSAGGGNICALMTSPLAQNLFHGASMQSSVPTACELQTLKDAQQRTGTRVVEATGCGGSTDVAACLRGKSMEEIVGAVSGGTNIYARVYGPVMDGHIFPDQPKNLIKARRYQPMPVIIGNTADETRTFLNVMDPVADADAYATALAKLFGESSRDAVLKRYPVANFPSPRAALEAATADAFFTCTTRRVARLFTAAQKEPVYTYFFSHILENDPQERARGSSHTVEHPFFFPWTGKYQPSDGERKLQDAMALYWSRMAVTGNPNAAPNPPWPRYDPQTDAYLELATPPRAGEGLKKEQCDFWDSVTLPWPHL